MTSERNLRSTTQQQRERSTEPNETNNLPGRFPSENHDAAREEELFNDHRDQLNEIYTEMRTNWTYLQQNLDTQLRNLSVHSTEAEWQLARAGVAALSQIANNSPDYSEFLTNQTEPRPQLPPQPQHTQQQQQEPEHTTHKQQQHQHTQPSNIIHRNNSPEPQTEPIRNNSLAQPATTRNFQWGRIQPISQPSFNYSLPNTTTYNSSRQSTPHSPVTPYAQIVQPRENPLIYSLVPSQTSIKIISDKFKQMSTFNRYMDDESKMDWIDRMYKSWKTLNSEFNGRIMTISFMDSDSGEVYEDEYNVPL